MSEDSNAGNAGNPVGTGTPGAIQQESYPDNYLNDANPVGGGAQPGRGRGAAQSGNNPVGGRR